MVRRDRGIDMKAAIHQDHDTSVSTDALRQSFDQHGIPQSRLESWKYTNLRSLTLEKFPRADKSSVVLEPEDLADLLPQSGDGSRLVLVNGQVSDQLSILPESGVTIRKETITTLEHPALAHLDLNDAANSLAALAVTEMGQSVVIDVDARSNCDNLLEIVHVAVGGESNQRIATGLMVNVQEGGSLQISESFHDFGEVGQWHNYVSLVALDAHSRLDWLRVQAASAKHYLYCSSTVSQKQGSNFSLHGFDVGGRITRHDTKVALVGEGAHCDLHGVYALDKRRHVDHQVCVDHISANASSSQVYKGIVDAGARGIWNGKAVVRKGADGTDARQKNANLLLSDKAEIDAKPELEIYADDVKCAHGATIGQLDARQLFYLQSRGIEESEARLLLTHAFCREVVEMVPMSSEHDRINALLAEHLPRNEALQDVVEDDL